MWCHLEETVAQTEAVPGYDIRLEADMTRTLLSSIHCDAHRSNDHTLVILKEKEFVQKKKGKTMITHIVSI